MPICVNEFCSNPVGCAYYCRLRKNDDALTILDGWVCKKLLEISMAKKENAIQQIKAPISKESIHNAQYDLLQELRHYMTIKINPHNRDDIEKYNKNILEEE
jgi:hypothetical protein